MIALNAAAQTVALGGIMVVQTVYLIMVARILGVEDFGRFSLVFSITQIFLIGGDLGLHNTLLRRISSEPARSREIFPPFFSLKLLIATGFVLVISSIALLLRESQQTRVCMILFGVGMFFHLTGLSLNLAFQAHGKLYLASLNSFLLFFLQALIGLTGLWFGGRLVWLGMAYLIATMLSLAVNWMLFQRHIHPVEWVFPRRWRQIMWESFPVGLGSLFENVTSRIAISLLAYLVGSYETGIFAAAGRVTTALRNLPMGIMSAVLPVMASHLDRPDKVRRLFVKSATVLLAISVPVAAILYLFAKPIILLVYGPSYLPAVGSLRILVWSLIPVSLGMALSHVLLSQGELVRRYPWVTGAVMTFTVVANFALIPRLQSQGAALVFLLAESVSFLLFGLAVWGFLRRGTRRLHP